MTATAQKSKTSGLEFYDAFLEGFVVQLRAQFFMKIRHEAFGLTIGPNDVIENVLRIRVQGRLKTQIQKQTRNYRLCHAARLRQRDPSANIAAKGLIHVFLQ